MKKLLSVLMAAAMLVGVLSLAGCGGNGGETTTDPAADADNSAATTETAGDLTTVTAGKLTMSTNAQFPPYEMVADDGSFEGIDIEVADAIAKKLGYEGVEVVDMEFDAIISDVATGKSMIGMAGLTANNERMQNIYFSFPYATGIQAVIVKEDSPITSVDDLLAEGAAYKAGVQMNTTGDIYASDDMGDDRVVRFNSGADAVMALKNGKVDCVIIDNEPAKAYVESTTGLKLLDTKYAEEEYAICVSKNNVELLGKVSAALQDLTSCMQTVEDCCGVRARLFRPPGGLYSDALLQAAKDADLSVILWSVDPCDWDEAAWDGVLPTVLSEAHDGRIILMHDLSAHSVTCALQAIDRLMAQGYEFCTVSQLAQLRGTALAPGEVYTGFPPKDS